jgi:ubiquinone/menaquinone biosynthesis C-methylase UbiE
MRDFLKTLSGFGRSGDFNENERKEQDAMPDPQYELPRENPSAYIVQDRDNQEEMTRLEIQDKMITTGMGGVLPELPDPTVLRRVLDVGCGTGGWLMETARTYPTIEKLVGADISNKMVEYARASAEAEQLGSRVQFHTTDALRALPFSNNYFDLVNQRFGISWLRTWEWRKILLEYERVSKPGGIIRITEGHVTNESNSPALAKLCKISLDVCFRSGRLFTEGTDGVTSELARLMTQHGIEDVKSRIHTLVYSRGTENWQYFYEDMLHMFRVALPFFNKWTRVPDDYQEIYQQALNEMQQPNFEATYTLLTAWGASPKDGRPMLMRGLR